MSAIVLIDSGNTRLKIGVVDGMGVVARAQAGETARAAHPGPLPIHMAHNLGNNDLHGLQDWLARLPARPVAALGTNVAGAARGGMIEAVLAAVGCPMQWIVPQARAYGLTSRYTRPEQLGADRWASMLGVLADLDIHDTVSAASHGRAAPASGSVSAPPSPGWAPAKPRPAFLLASFGTATTLDTVSSDGVFEGGLILPGPALMRQSLASGTANLPLAHGTLQDFPTDTHQAISSGVAAAQAGAVVRQWLAGVRQYGEPPRVYAAGGGWTEVEAETRRLLADAATAMGRLPPEVTVIENPVLKGLAYIAGQTNLGST